VRRVLRGARAAKDKLDRSETAAAPVPASTYSWQRAPRPIGIFYDELSRGLNPFSLIETIGVADADADPGYIADLFDQFGIVKIRGLYDPEQSRHLQADCVDFSGLAPLDIRDVITKKREWGTGGAPVLNDDRFWPYVVHPGLKPVLDRILGTNTLEFGTAVAAHYSARGLHRDYRMLVEDPESAYFADEPKKRIVRVLHYCGLNGGALGYIPFSHDASKFAEQGRRVGQKRPAEWFDRHREVLTHARLHRDFVQADEIERHIMWAYADPGDVIVSNSAMLHCGDYLTGPRYFFVSTYAQSDSETLPLALRNAVTSQSRPYYEYLRDHGFMGSVDVLAGIDSQTAAADTRP